MGSIRNLRDGSMNVHLLLSNSNLSELYIYDTLKSKCNATRDSIYDINTKSSTNEMFELVNLQPFNADKWLFVIDFSKVKSILKNKIGVFDSDTSEFLIKVKNYKEFKEAKEMLKKVNDIYLSFIRYYDVEFLLDGYNLSPKMVEFVARSYSSDVEQVFQLLNELKNGLVVNDRKDIVNICGVSSGSLNTFALMLLKDFPTTDKGKKMAYKKRITTAVELAETYGFSKMRNFLMTCVKDILDIKQLYLAGVIYDRIHNLPSCYDEKRLSRYNMYLSFIINTPINKIMKLYLMLRKNGRWYSDIDMVSFIYQYYEEGEL